MIKVNGRLKILGSLRFGLKNDVRYNGKRKTNNIYFITEG